MGKHETGYARVERDLYPTPHWVVSALATLKRPPTLTADNQMTRKSNFALNAEMKAAAERLTLPLCSCISFALPQPRSSRIAEPRCLPDEGWTLAAVSSTT